MMTPPTSSAHPVIPGCLPPMATHAGMTKPISTATVLPITPKATVMFGTSIERMNSAARSATCRRAGRTETKFQAQQMATIKCS